MFKRIAPGIRIPSLIKGMISFIPGAYALVDKRRGGAATASSLYAYEVWMKHLSMLYGRTGVTSVPGTVAEIGPGQSLGIGLAAMLSGANQYFALDVVRHANDDRNLRVFDELVAHFRNRTSRPKPGWPNYDQYLDEDLFPGHILSTAVSEKNLAADRVTRLREELQLMDEKSSIRYIVPWFSPEVIKPGTVDFAFSTSALEHVVDLPTTYRALYRWLKPGGLMSHQKEFRSHGLTPAWNGHRACPEFIWKLTYGKRPYLINREPISIHIELMEAAGFEVIADLRNYRNDGIKRDQLNSRWRHISDIDLNCHEAFIQARKPV